MSVPRAMNQKDIGVSSVSPIPTMATGSFPAPGFDRADMSSGVLILIKLSARKLVVHKFRNMIQEVREICCITLFKMYVHDMLDLC